MSHRIPERGKPVIATTRSSRQAFFGRKDEDLYLGLPPVVVKLFLSMWIVFIFVPLNAMLHEHRAILPTVGVLCLLGIYVAIFLFTIWGDWNPSKQGKFVSIALVTAEAILALAIAVQYGPSWMELFFFVGCIAGLRLPVRDALKVIPGIALLAVCLGWRIHAGFQDIAITVVVVCGLGMAMVGLVQTAGTIKKLREARQEIERLAASEAVAEERLRFARDLHDLLGHSLSLITLKSELAGRITNSHPERAIKEMQEIESVARGMLREVRQAVQNYRQPSLIRELDGAKEMLTAAGIQHHVDVQLHDLPPAVEAALAWTVRETVTNVIRHAHAKHCDIKIINEGGTIRASVVNDGSVVGTNVNSPSSSGSGLSGIRERISSLRGKLELALVDGQFRVEVTIPAALDTRR